MEREEIKKAIYELVEKSMGKKKLKPGDVFKKIASDHGVEKAEVKAALRELLDAGTLVYSYKGGSYVELPPKE
jgi:DNA-binding transcriptional regulator YhcF (GntR family)